MHHWQVQQPDAEPRPPPGVTEALLLQQLLRTRASAGGCLDPAVQLCVTCEVCRRPATKECWTCRMAICDFCTRRQHWKVGNLEVHASAGVRVQGLPWLSDTGAVFSMAICDFCHGASTKR
jgi:hypothetical protein